ncbi:MAG: Spy/CpxP family protein refolding chaperone [Herbaspirillum sp.]
MKQTLAMIVVALAITVPLTVCAQPQGRGLGMMGGNGYGQGMMGGYGSEMMGGDGYAMMGGYGSGMMGSRWERGCGAGSYRDGWGIPDLTAEQQTKIQAIQEEFRAKQWELMGKMQEQGVHSGMMGWNHGSSDEAAARKAYDEAAAIRKQMFENRLAIQKRIDTVLTAKQREQLNR